MSSFDDDNSRKDHDDEERTTTEEEEGTSVLVTSKDAGTASTVAVPSASQSEDESEKQPPISQSPNYTVSLEECLFGAEHVSLGRLRKLSSTGIHDLVGQEQHNEFSWRGLSWRILLGYLPGVVESTRNEENMDWKAALQDKRQVYYDLVKELFQSDYDSHHGEELISGYVASNPSKGQIDSLSNSVSSLVSGSNHDTINAFIKELWKKTGRDVPVLEGLTRGLNALIINDAASDGESSIAEEAEQRSSIPAASTSPIRSALLLDEIRKDVVRTHPDLAFFVDPVLGRRRYAALERILLCACWQSHTSYVQGMNEIVAVLYYVLATTTVVKDPSDTPVSVLAQENWAAHAEVDAYWLFRILLEDIHAVYNRDLDDDEAGIRGRLLAMENLLKKHDPEVMEHLQENELDASFFAIRWWTTLLSREFLLPDTTRLWDSMFASTHKDNFLRYVCATMIMTVRESLLKGDFSTCLRLLQAYPSTHMDQLLESTRALWLYESQITIACHKGGIGLHQALETIAPPPAIIMAFGLRGGSLQQDEHQQTVQELADIAAERVRDVTTNVAVQANMWLGKAKTSFVLWNKKRSKSSGELDQQNAAQVGVESSSSGDRSSPSSTPDVQASLSDASGGLMSSVSALNDDIYFQAISKGE
jgi:hypothetical protein